ncbi:hypothetical protein [Halorussus caseinilyticus]|uniref:Uncharacterized protein n=1 Tax=Halorussus caseinilyticus TaxID=3034025 RepID=A0ABD5WK76_9EURY|nr:hypothetical protein [Halorussus sp. DT72]
MEERGKPRPLAFRVPVSDGFWREYGISLGLLVLALSAVAVVAARDPGDGVVVGATFVGLSAGAILAGLAVYNVVVAALIAAKR